MRTIKKRPPPRLLVQWRAARNAAADDAEWPYNYEDLRRDENVILAVEQALFNEQGGICAYTGSRISFQAEGSQGFHIEHLKPQQYCKQGEDTDFGNLAACWPEPNFQAHVDYGAKRKDNWPSPEEAANFVSPLRENCSVRFTYTKTGEIAAKDKNDSAASITIKKLGLDHGELTERRMKAIRGALTPRKGQLLTLSEALKVQETMRRAEESLGEGQYASLVPFCFAIKPFIAKEIRKLEGIRKSHRKPSTG